MTTEITKPIDPMKAFQDKVVEKLKTDIADMLPPEVLQTMVQRTIEEQFFKPRKIVDSRFPYSVNYIDAPSWFVEEVTKVAKPVLENMTKKFVEENKDKLEEALKLFVRDQNLLLLAMEYMNAQTRQSLDSLAYAIRENK